MRPLLIVNADDYGLTAKVSEGILTAHDKGVVTSTSVLAVAEAFDQSVPLLRSSSIGVGVHLALVGEDPPLLSASEIPSLVDRTGAFRTSWRELSANALLGRLDGDDVRRELGAQIERLQQAGVTLDHLDSHQHVHLLPGIAPVVCQLAIDHGIDALRLPGTAGWGPSAVGVRALARGLRRRTGSLGLVGPATFGGMEHSGHLTHEAFGVLVAELRSRDVPSAEIGIHPGAPDDPDRWRFEWGFEWEEELATLCSERARSAIDAAGFRLGTFGDLAGDERQA